MVMKHVLSPSLLSVDFNHMERGIDSVIEGGAGYIHIDVMDGMFVPNISFGPPVIKYINKAAAGRATMDCHLMIEDPIRYIGAFKDCGADIFTFHIEAARHIDSVIREVHNAGMKCGIALNPATDISLIGNVAEMVDMILIMSVNPGFGGQKYISYSTDKIRSLRSMLDQRGLSTDIEVDGGVTLGNVREVLDAGANIIVAGSAVFSGDPGENVRAFNDILRSYD